MRIVHFAPFAPNCCGLYEAARDMIIADRMMGHDSHLIDTGPVSEGGVHTPGKPGQIDERGGTVVKTDELEIINYADIIVAHTGIPDEWIVKTQAPIIWILHGRPAACFKPEMFGRGISYTLMHEVCQWPRVKYAVTFWPYHIDYWKVIIPEEKIVCFNYPPIDETRFSDKGYVYDFAGKTTKFNMVVSESLRDDVDIFDLMHGIIKYSKNDKNFTVHLFGIDPPQSCWEFILKELRVAGVLGVVWQRRTNMEEVYRGADLLVSPHTIVTRSIGEALCCNVPVLANLNCSIATWNTDMSNPSAICDALGTAIQDLRTNKNEILEMTRQTSRVLHLHNFALNMNYLYQKLVN